MAKKQFKTGPVGTSRAVVDPSSPALERFAAGAETRSFETEPWAGLDPKAKPTSGINLRLNKYELALLRHVAASDDRSIQRTIKRLLVPALESAAKPEGIK